MSSRPESPIPEPLVIETFQGLMKAYNRRDLYLDAVHFVERCTLAELDFTKYLNYKGHFPVMNIIYKGISNTILLIPDTLYRICELVALTDCYDILHRVYLVIHSVDMHLVELPGETNIDSVFQFRFRGMYEINTDVEFNIRSEYDDPILLMKRLKQQQDDYKELTHVANILTEEDLEQHPWHDAYMDEDNVMVVHNLHTDVLVEVETEMEFRSVSTPCDLYIFKTDDDTNVVFAKQRKHQVLKALNA